MALDLFGEEFDWADLDKPKSSIFTQIGATAFGHGERQAEDFYATEPTAVFELLEREKFKETVLEPCVGMGHIAGVLTECGYKVVAQDIVDRGYPNTTIKDFLIQEHNEYDIVTNPPYVLAKEFVEHALDISPNGTKVAMFLKLTFLESKKRKLLFERYPIKTLWVCSERRNCAKNGDFISYPVNSAIAYGWYVWEKGYKGESIIKWI